MFGDKDIKRVKIYPTAAELLARVITCPNYGIALSKIYEQAYKEGYSDGHDMGYIRGYSEGLGEKSDRF